MTTALRYFSSLDMVYRGTDHLALLKHMQRLLHGVAHATQSIITLRRQCFLLTQG